MLGFMRLSAPCSFAVRRKRSASAFDIFAEMLSFDKF